MGAVRRSPEFIKYSHTPRSENQLREREVCVLGVLMRARPTVSSEALHYIIFD